MQTFVLALLALHAFADETPPPAPPVEFTAETVMALPARMTPSEGDLIGWLDDEHYVVRAGAIEPGEKQYFVVQARTGMRRSLFDADAFSAALQVLPGVSKDAARTWSRGVVQCTADYRGVLLEQANDVFFWSIGSDRAIRLTHDDQEEVGVTLSPDGQMVAFLRGANLYVVGTDGSRERPLTHEGGGDVLLGRLDWVYQEEIYGRGNFQGFFWSPDSRRIAYLALDESPVPPYTIVDHRKTRPDVEVWRYPKAGDANPRATLHIVDVVGGAARTADLRAYERDEYLIVRVAFTPDGREVIAQIQDRIQTWLDVLAVDAEDGASRRLFRDRTGVWIEPSDAPFWTADVTQFVWLSERDGYRHLYLYRRDGRLLRQVTHGTWEVDAVHGIGDDGTIYFTGDQQDVRGGQLMSVSKDGGVTTAITTRPGTHEISMSPGLALYRDTWSSLSDPGDIRVRSLEHDDDDNFNTVRVVTRGSLAPLLPFGVTAPEFVKVRLIDGFTLEAMLFKPPGFDEKKRYPVVSYVYGGPHATQVRDRYFNRHRMYHHWLQQQGFLVWICDNRSASGKGLQSVKGIYKNLGEEELRDQLAALDWLGQQPFVDPSRIGVWGWSYGGFMTAYALTHTDRYKVGVCGAPVTDWRFYDSIYTERYMDTPQNNPDGYARSSVIRAAADFTGKMLLIHGTIDENVHLQNSFQLVEALQRAGKRFDLMVYPGNRHWIADEAQQAHLYRMMAEYFASNL